ncbi:MAG TPA: AI-2E family transporter [Acidimicrobiia bacterium]|jgi:predicted PurR-regulated permease PerM|nr:AI-2E family transporter [Acidimicrobiia bacterium]
MAGDERSFIRKVLVVALVVLGVAAALWLAWRLRNLLSMVFVALFVAVAFEPPVHYLHKRGWRRGAATGAVFLAALVVIVVFFWALVPLFVEQFQQLIDSVPGIVESFLLFLEETFQFDLAQVDPSQVGQDLLNSIQGLGGAIAGGLVGLASTVLGFVFFATTVALFAFYMIAELPKLQRTVLSFMPEEQQHRAIRIWDVAVEKMGGYVYSRLILGVISATLTTIFLQALGVRFAVSLGIWVGVLSQFVPVVGTYLAAILPALVALSFNSASTALWVVVYLVVYQQVENYLISPRITKRTMEIHPAVSVAAIIIGGTLMGGVGVILALPMAGIIQAIVSETRKSYEVILDGDDGGPAEGA